MKVFIHHTAWWMPERTKCRDEMRAVNKKIFEAYAGEPGSPQSAPAVKDETRQSGRIKHEGMKEIKKYSIKNN